VPSFLFPSSFCREDRKPTETQKPKGTRKKGVCEIYFYKVAFLKVDFNRHSGVFMIDSASCWKLDSREVASIREQLEKRHQVRLPEVEVRYSDNIKGAFFTTGIKLPRYISKERRERLEASWKNRLKLKGLKDDELKEINPYNFTIFLARRYPSYPVDLYGELWHEFGHVLAHTLDVRDKTHNEGVAYACGFRGLLLEALDGKFSMEKAVDEIERQIKGAETSLPLFPHRTALRVVKDYNVERGCFEDLSFRNCDPEKLIVGLDRKIQKAVEDDKDIRDIVAKRQLARVEKPFVGILAITMIILFILSRLI